MTVYKSNIITCNANYDTFQYLAEEDGIIKYVGNSLPEKYRTQPLIDLSDKAIIPTFSDNHTHFVSYAVLSMALDISNIKSNAEIKELIRKRNSKKTVFAFGANKTKVTEQTFITKEDLDEVCPNVYAVLITSDGHGMIVNSKALRSLPQSIKTTRGYNPDSGLIINEAFYVAVSALSKLLPKKDIIASFANAIDRMAKRGIGHFVCCVGSSFPKDIDVNLFIWAAKGQRSGVQMRIMYQTFNVDKVTKRGLPRLGGCFECALDGSIGLRDAALNEPYCGTDNKGILYHTDEELMEKVSRANKSGLSVQMHAIGDAAFDQAVRAIKYALDECPRADHRHGIIHASMPTEEGMRICKEYNIQIIAQFAFLDLQGNNFEPMYEALGERVYAAEPYRQLWDLGLVISAGSDAPVTEPDPIQWLNKACNNLNYKNRLSVGEALRACTHNGYYSTFDEDKRGSLEEGKIADMVILSKNPYAIDKKELGALEVEATIFAGKKYERPKGGILSAIARGIFTPANKNY